MKIKRHAVVVARWKSGIWPLDVLNFKLKIDGIQGQPEIQCGTWSKWASVEKGDEINISLIEKPNGKFTFVGC